MSNEVAVARDTWDAEDDAAVVAHLRRLGSVRNGYRPYGPEGPFCTQDRSIYITSWMSALGEYAGVVMEFDYVVTDRHGEARAELAVHWNDPADPLASLHDRLNLLSSSARDRLAKGLAERSSGLSLPWQRMLDQACEWVIRSHRAGEPAILLRDAPDRISADALTDPPLLEPDGMSMVFGDGGAGKSLLALALGLSLHTGQQVINGIEPSAQRRVAYLDWEWSATPHKERMRQLMGPDMPDLVYLRCRRPLHEERDRLRRAFHANQVEYAIVDSVALACGGEPESAEVATRFSNVLGELVPAALAVAHVNRAQASDRAGADRPFGSAFWHNSARSTWYVRQAEATADSLVIGLYNRKVNDRAPASPFALEYRWSGERLAIGRVDMRDIPELDAQRSIGSRMRDLLGKRGPMKLHEIADEMGENVESVKKAAQRGKGRGLVALPGPDGAYRWALKQEA